MKFISLATVPYILPFVKTELGNTWYKFTCWKFLSNDENKQQFIKLLLEFSSKDSFAIKTQGRDVVLVCKDKAFNLTSADDIKTETEEEILSLSIY